MRGNGQPRVDEPPGFGGVGVEQRPVGSDIGIVQVVAAHLVLGLAERLAIGDPRSVGDVLEMAHALERHDDALHAVGDLHRHRVERHPAGLLKVGELGDFQAIQPHLPAQSPGAQRGGCPVVLDEPHIMRAGVDAECGEAAEIQLLGIAGLGLEDDLELGVGLQPVGIVAVPAVVGPHARLGVGDPPRLGAQDPQRGRRVKRPRPHLGIHGLHDHATMPGPVPRQGEQGILHREHD